MSLFGVDFDCFLGIKTLHCGAVLGFHAFKTGLMPCLLCVYHTVVFSSEKQKKKSGEQYNEKKEIKEIKKKMLLSDQQQQQKQGLGRLSGTSVPRVVHADLQNLSHLSWAELLIFL